MAEQSKTGPNEPGILDVNELMKPELTARQLTTLRERTHGDWKAQASVCDAALEALGAGPNWATMPAWRRMAIMNIVQKLSRIVAGDHEEADHWDDIAGYAHLGKNGHSGR